MPNYNQAHQFYAGVDLHARSMFVHIVSAKGKIVFEKDLPAEPVLGHALAMKHIHGGKT